MVVSSHLDDILSLGLRTDAEVVVTVDTEYHGTHTLTVQAATRLDQQTLAVQLYKSPAVPGLPTGFEVEKYLPPEKYRPFFSKAVVRPVKPLAADLSPMRMVADLLGIDGIDILTRQEGQRLVHRLEQNDDSDLPSNVSRSRGRLRLPSLSLTIAGHYLNADFARIHGRDFLAGLGLDTGDVVLRCRKVVQFADPRRPGDPVLQYCRTPLGLHEVRVRTRDTLRPFGPASLDSLARTFLGVGKLDSIGGEDKIDMRRTFADRTSDAYGYAIADAVLTLLVYEGMQQRDREVYRSFGFPETAIPPMRGTLGGRVSTFLVQATRRCMGESRSLPSGRALEDLMRRGGMDLFRRHPGASRYGDQTGKVHGGLLYSRSPTRLWHDAPGMLRDVDMASCYQSIVSRMDVHWGRPVVLETGGTPLPLKDAVDLMGRVAPEDGWFARVSGGIEGVPNALLPSTDNAVTSANYRSAMRQGRRARRQARRDAFHLESLRDPGSARGTGGSRLYASVVESGIVTHRTWLMVQALPSGMREQYERLNADSVVFYPRKLVAADGREFDELTEKHRHEGLPWDQALDLEGMWLLTRERIDAGYVSLRFPIGEHARRIGEFRRQAREAEGRGSGADLAWKVHANSIYGVLACAHLPTNNMVAGNVVTAWARAAAFALSQSLNAIQTVTDGCTFRLDQIPACTFEECVRAMPEYTVRRAEDGDGIPFVDPAAIPHDDDGFTEWYRHHVHRFLNVSGPAWDSLFDTHRLEFKRAGRDGPTAFDGLAADGTANYCKCLLGGDGVWRGVDFAARSFREPSKAGIMPWLVGTYSSDRLEAPAPLAEDTELLSFASARRKARAALASGRERVLLPLGLEVARTANYKCLKASSFTFRTPSQRASILRQVQRFEDRTGCGLEVLALRRSYGGRRQGSLADLAAAVHEVVRSGTDRLSATLNLARLPADVRGLARSRIEELRARRRRAGSLLLEAMDPDSLGPFGLATALVLTRDQLGLVGSRETGLPLAMQGTSGPA